MKKPFYDLHRLSESDRIEMIGTTASSGKSAGFVLENDDEKIARYLAAFAARFPDLKVTRLGALTPGTVAFRAERVQN